MFGYKKSVMIEARVKKALGPNVDRDSVTISQLGKIPIQSLHNALPEPVSKKCYGRRKKNMEESSDDEHRSPNTFKDYPDWP